MNIIVKPHGSDLCYCRPDTTWERENKDFYVPEGIGQIHWAPVLFVRISKAGKCIGKKFASRYYDSFSYGALLYCVADGDMNVAFSSCADHSSYLPMPLYETAVLNTEENTFELYRADEKIYEAACGENLKAALEEAICKASTLTSLRIGDYVAIELTASQPLCTKEAGNTKIKASFCEKETISVNIIF